MTPKKSTKKPLAIRGTFEDVIKVAVKPAKKKTKKNGWK